MVNFMVRLMMPNNEPDALLRPDVTVCFGHGGMKAERGISVNWHLCPPSLRHGAAGSGERLCERPDIVEIFSPVGGDLIKLETSHFSAAPVSAFLRGQ
jgi:hypothetical protein